MKNLKKETGIRDALATNLNKFKMNKIKYRNIALKNNKSDKHNKITKYLIIH